MKKYEMREPVISCMDPDIIENPYDFYYALKYKGEWFTGTVLKDDGKSFVQFKDGNADGIAVDFYGDFADEEYYIDGVLQNKNDGPVILTDKDGLKIYEDGSWFYKNGVVKMKSQSGHGSILFSPEGELAIITLYKPIENLNYIFHRVMLKHYFEMLINLYPNIDTIFNHTRYEIFSWISEVYVQDPEHGESLLRNLLNHPDKETIEFAERLLRFAEGKKAGSQERTYWLEPFRNTRMIW